MAMEVNGNFRDYKNEYLERMQEEKDRIGAVGKAQEADKRAEAVQTPKDEYISSEQSGSRPSGLYRMGQDENGNPKVLYDDPKKAGGADGDEQSKVKPGSPEKEAEKVTGNTDKVDREIEKLKKQRQQLEQQIREASGDEEKTRELEKKLSQVERELSRKDNDTYRRQHTVFY